MKRLLLAAGALLALVGGHYAIGERSDPAARSGTETDPFTTGSIASGHLDENSPRRYRVFVAGRDEGCTLMKGRTLADGTAAVRIGPECGVLYPAMTKIGLWRDEEGEAVALTTEGGRTVLDLAPGDGVAYESWRPAAPLLSLVAN